MRIYINKHILIEYTFIYTYLCMCIYIQIYIKYMSILCFYYI